MKTIFLQFHVKAPAVRIFLLVDNSGFLGEKKVLFFSIELIILKNIRELPIRLNFWSFNLT